METAASVVEGIDGTLSQARALYNHVNELVPKQSRNVEGYRVLLEKSGNRNTLFKTLLKAVGIDASWAFLKAPEMAGTTVHWEYPRVGLFSGRNLFVCIEEAPGTDPLERTFLSLSGRNMPFARVPEHLEGGAALILTDEGHKLVSLPSGDPRRYATSVNATVSLGGGTDGEVDLVVRDRRSGALVQKDRFRTIRGFQKGVVLQSLANRLFPGSRLKKGDFPGLDDPEAPFSIELDLSTPNLLQQSGDDLLLKSVVTPAQLVNNYCGRTQREHPFQLSAQHVIFDRIRILPGELRAVRLPADAALSCELGTYSLSCHEQQEKLLVERELTLRPGRIKPANFAAFVNFCQAVDTAENESLIFRKPPPEEPPESPLQNIDPTANQKAETGTEAEADTAASQDNG